MMDSFTVQTFNASNKFLILLMTFLKPQLDFLKFMWGFTFIEINHNVKFIWVNIYIMRNHVRWNHITLQLKF